MRLEFLPSPGSGRMFVVNLLQNFGNLVVSLVGVLCRFVGLLKIKSKLVSHLDKNIKLDQLFHWVLESVL